MCNRSAAKIPTKIFQSNQRRLQHWNVPWYITLKPIASSLFQLIISNRRKWLNLWIRWQSCASIRKWLLKVYVIIDAQSVVQIEFQLHACVRTIFCNQVRLRFKVLDISFWYVMQAKHYNILIYSIEKILPCLASTEQGSR